MMIASQNLPKFLKPRLRQWLCELEDEVKIKFKGGRPTNPVFLKSKKTLSVVTPDIYEEALVSALEDLAAQLKILAQEKEMVSCELFDAQWASFEPYSFKIIDLQLQINF